VCEKICLPARAQATLALGAPGASPDAAALAEARARVPQKVAAGALGAEVSATGDKAWRLCLAERPRELFVEAPEGFWVEPKREGDGRCYALTLQQAPEGGKPPIALRLTVEGESGARETQVTLGG
jgi:DsbC/DsbD-like thiol-disulfide interchange protein